MMKANLFKIPSTQETTSPFLPWLVTDTFSETAAESQPSEPWFHEIAERVALPTLVQKGVECRPLPQEKSAYPSKFISNIVVKTSSYNLFYQAFKNQYFIFINHAGNTELNNFFSQQEQFTEGPSDDVWTVASWVTDSDKECTMPLEESLFEIKSEIYGLLDNFKKGLPFKWSEELLSMADKVAKERSQRKGENIEEWAEKLSNDLSKLSD